MRIFGIDYGDKKIGLAFGDSETRVAVPLEAILNSGDFTLRALKERIKNENIELVVIGVPLSTGGHHGPEQLEKTRNFIKDFQAVTGADVVEEDESYTTAESIRLRCEEGAQANEDALAAMLILQSYFDKL
jgi:putative Holliday junction resolvase